MYETREIYSCRMYIFGPIGKIGDLFCFEYGDNAHDGTSELLPWKTLSYAASQVSSDDILKLHKGDIFRESVDFGTIEIVSYGEDSDALPIVSGSAVVEDWTLYTGNIYMADFSGEPGYLFVDNTLVRIARYPNTGWLRTTTWTENSDGTHTVLTSQL